MNYSGGEGVGVVVMAIVFGVLFLVFILVTSTDAVVNYRYFYHC